jgi:hypothetical protein
MTGPFLKRRETFSIGKVDGPQGKVPRKRTCPFFSHSSLFEQKANISGSMS